MNFADFIGHTLDEKYKIERELGKGGMGTVYLATHVGTGRPVAVKIIAPQFMERREFIERFRREARAAGRLRHPNVVNVTDFGFAETKSGNVAYLVMEYLDGCTLGEILEEEQKLPLAWTLDILEQVCSAVHEAHVQGIIHRDLKPDNIWLEPNQRGGYTVKVLDFGIAKLEENFSAAAAENISGDFAVSPQQTSSARATIADPGQAETLADSKHSTNFGEASTAIQTPESKTIFSEAGTIVKADEHVEDVPEIWQANRTTVDEQSNIGTKLITSQPVTNKALDKASENASTTGKPPLDQTTKELTRIGAVLGTPLYMSPEQCRGEKLTSHSDIYSLGVIAYQMLSGKTPFSGDYKAVMEAHKEAAAPALNVKKVPQKVKKVINSALAKNTADRPQTAQAFASEIRAQSEGVGTLFRRALEIYSKHLPKFLGLSILLYLPLALVTFVHLLLDVFYVGDQISDASAAILSGALKLSSTFVGIFCGYFVFGTTTWIVAQTLAVPLRPVHVRQALKAMRKRWKSLVGTGILTTVLSFIGYLFCLLPGVVLSVLWALVAPVVMMENLRGKAAMKRSTALVKRSLRTTTAAVFIMFFVPFLVASLVGAAANITVKAFSSDAAKVEEIKREVLKARDENRPLVKIEETNDTKQIVFGNKRLNVNDQSSGAENFGKRLREVVVEDATTILMLPFQILIASLWSIIAALLYLKTRQAGGESMQDLLVQFEEVDQPRTNWQRRVHERLEQSGKLTGNRSDLMRKSNEAMTGN
ncbi:MAG: Serine/threonine protein kinase [Acidobacteria bacterium]|jgi:serine/threonine protein kinase|nr:Serine/threonine protein kinase [Acidobacteriota bacterium]